MGYFEWANIRIGTRYLDSYNTRRFGNLRVFCCLNPENEAELTKAIEELTRNNTIIMIAHRLKTVRHADQILVVSDGKIVQRGTHEELMDRQGIYRNFVSERREAVSWKIA